MSEKLLIQRAEAGDDDAFSDLLSPYKNYLLKVIYSFLKNMPESEDAYQEVSHKIHQGLPTYTGPNLKAWFTRIAMNHCIDQIRRRKIMEIDLDDTQNSIEPAGLWNEEVSSPEEIVISKETQNELAKIVDSLPAQYREVIQLHYFSELTYKEISLRLEINERTVETRIYRARKMVAKIWRKNATL